MASGLRYFFMDIIGGVVEKVLLIMVDYVFERASAFV